MKKGFLPLKKFIFFLGAELFALLFAVWFFDPFYQYHEPFIGEAVLNDRDNQMPGTIRNFSYDSVLVGSSVAENCDTDYLDERFDVTALKIIRAGGSTADLLYYLNMARENHTLKKVFWCLDISALEADTSPTLKKGGDAPWHLHTETVLDDVPYLCNKEILLKTVPKNLVSAGKKINTGGNAYSWARGKTFSAQGAMAFYQKPAEADVLESLDFQEDKDRIDANIGMLIEEAREHPETEFVFFFPPYSMAWWDCARVNGFSEKNFYILERAMGALLQCPNVKVYFFMDLEEILDLDNYMDLIHYDPKLNQKMLELMASDRGRVTPENAEKILKNMRELQERICTEEIYRYYPRE